MNGAGVAAVVGGYASAICLAASQTAARYDLPYVVDVGVVDSIVTPRPEEHLPLRPGLRRHRQDRASRTLAVINKQAGKPAKTVMIVHEDSAIRRRPRQAAATRKLPDDGFEVLETIPHRRRRATSTTSC